MKNFKKVLALVLVMATLLSFATIASAENKTSAVYGDAADIKYVEAVDVLTAIGVIDGISGDFKPGATLTRAQAAKIIAVFNNGDTDINKLYASANPFTDVEAGHWAESYIAYCYKMGIVGGVGDNKFDPNAEVTGIQFLKMALCVLGYDAEEEGLGGTSWAVNTLALAKDAGLLEVLGKKYDYSAAISREAAVQIMFNALLADCVEYGYGLKANEDYLTVAGAIPMEIDEDDKLDSKESNSEKYADGVLQLFEDWELTLIETVDIYARPARAWRFDRNEIGEVYTEAADYVYNANVLGCDFYDATGLLGSYDAVVVDKDGIKHIEDGVTVVDSRTDGNRLNYTDKTVDGERVRQGNSVRMEVYVDPNGDRDEDDSIIYFIHTYLGEVVSAKAAKVDSKGHETAPAEVKIDVHTGYNGTMYPITTSYWAEADGFAKEDMVLVTFGENEDGETVVATVDAAKDAVVSYDRKTKDGNVIMGGKGIAISKNMYLGWLMIVQPEEYVTNDIKVYYDQYNRPIGAEPYDEIGTYGVLSAMWVDYVRGDAVLKADFVYADGTEMEEVDVLEVVIGDSIYDYEDIFASEAANYEVNDANEFMPYYGLLYRITDEGDDEYTLTAVSHIAEAGDMEIKSASKRMKLTTVETSEEEYYKLNEETCFIVEEEAAPRGEYNVFKGNDKLTACDADVRAYDFDDNGTADIVYLTDVIEQGTRAVAWYNGGEIEFVEIVKDDEGDNNYIYEVELAVVSDDGTTVETDTYQFNNGTEKLASSNNFLAALESEGFIALNSDDEITELVYGGLFNCFIDEDGYVVVSDYDEDMIGSQNITAADADGEFFELMFDGEAYEVMPDEVEIWAVIDGDDELVKCRYEMYEGYKVSYITNKKGEVLLVIAELNHVTFSDDDVEFVATNVFAGRLCDDEVFRINGAEDYMYFESDDAIYAFDGTKGLTVNGYLPLVIEVSEWA